LTGIEATISSLFSFIKNTSIKDLVLSPMDTMGKLGDALDPSINFAGMFSNIGDEVMKSYRDTLKNNLVDQGEGKDGAPNSQNIINVGKLEINQDFKEKQNPDRIAFSIKEQLVKTATNARTQATRTSMVQSRGYGVTAGV
jgi:hypothetical protein